MKGFKSDLSEVSCLMVSTGKFLSPRIKMTENLRTTTFNRLTKLTKDLASVSHFTEN